jgi:hypothetical protein
MFMTYACKLGRLPRQTLPVPVIMQPQRVRDPTLRRCNQASPHLFIVHTRICTYSLRLHYHYAIPKVHGVQ